MVRRAHVPLRAQWRETGQASSPRRKELSAPNTSTNNWMGSSTRETLVASPWNAPLCSARHGQPLQSNRQVVIASKPESNERRGFQRTFENRTKLQPVHWGRYQPSDVLFRGIETGFAGQLRAAPSSSSEQLHLDRWTLQPVRIHLAGLQRTQSFHHLSRPTYPTRIRAPPIPSIARSRRSKPSPGARACQGPHRGAHGGGWIGTLGSLTQQNR